MLVFPILTHICKVIWGRWKGEREWQGGGANNTIFQPNITASQSLPKYHTLHTSPLNIFPMSKAGACLMSSFIACFIFLSVSTQHSAGKRQMRLKHIFTNHEMMKMMNDGIDDIDEPNNWNLYVSPCQYRYRVPSEQKKCRARFYIFVILTLLCFQGLPQQGNLGSVLELFKLTFHSQAPLIH